MERARAACEKYKTGVDEAADEREFLIRNQSEIELNWITGQAQQHVTEVKQNLHAEATAFQQQVYRDSELYVKGAEAKARLEKEAAVEETKRTAERLHDEAIKGFTTEAQAAVRHEQAAKEQALLVAQRLQAELEQLRAQATGYVQNLSAEAHSRLSTGDVQLQQAEAEKKEIIRLAFEQEQALIRRVQQAEKEKEDWSKAYYQEKENQDARATSPLILPQVKPVSPGKRSTSPPAQRG